MWSEFGSDTTHGMLGLRCCRLPYGNLVAYFPGLIFITAYMLCIRQALFLISLANRSRLTILAKILLGSFFLYQSYEIWILLLHITERIIELFSKDGTHNHELMRNFCDLSVHLELTKLGVCFIISTLPIFAWLILVKKQQRFRFMLMDLRRRYCGELGSERYYLSRPCRELEGPHDAVSSISLRKTKSEPDLLVPKHVSMIPPRYKSF